MAETTAVPTDRVQHFLDRFAHATPLWSVKSQDEEKTESFELWMLTDEAGKSVPALIQRYRKNAGFDVWLQATDLIKSGDTERAVRSAMRTPHNAFAT